jgi:hypothetical protein
MATESGDNKLLGNYRKLIDQLSADPNYNPSNPALAKTAMETQYTAARAAVDDVSTKQAPNKLAITERQVGYDNLALLVTRSFNLLKASGASKDIIADAETHVRKLSGKRRSAKPKNDPATPADEAKASHSSSQMGFDNQLGNLGSYLAVLSNVPSYNPNETDLKVIALKAVAADLQAKNDAVSTTFAALGRARGLRDGLLYLNDDSVVNTGQLAKAYVKGALGTSSNLNKQIKGLEFKKANK